MRTIGSIIMFNSASQFRIPGADGIARQKLDDCERTFAHEDKLLVLLHKINGLRDPLCFPVLDVVLPDVSRRTLVFSVVHTVCLNRWEHVSIHS